MAFIPELSSNYSKHVHKCSLIYFVKILFLLQRLEWDLQTDSHSSSQKWTHNFKKYKHELYNKHTELRKSLCNMITGILI